MKKIFTLFVALLVGFALHAQQTPQWQMMGTPFTTSDINGNTVSLADTLAAGKAVVIQYEAAWNSWGWVVHTNGVMEAIHNTLGSQVCVLLAFVDPTTTNADIYGTGNNTQGDWTSGGTVPFPIINDANCADIIGGVDAYPTIIFISPSGYWCELYGTDWGFGPYDASAAVTSVSNVLLGVPQANHAPIVEISGQANVMVNTSIPLTANVVSIDPVTSYAWDVDGGTVVSNVNEDIVVQWSSAGIKTVTCAVTNLGSDGISRTTSGTLIVNVRESWNWGDTMSYCGNGDYSSAIGLGSTGEITWGVRIPAQYMAGRNYLSSAMAYISNPGNYELLVYNPAPDSLPSTPIYQQTYNVGITNDWYSFPLFSMVQVDTTNDLWIVLHCNGVSYPASYCTYVGDTNSSLILYNGSWTSIQSLASDLDPTWMIKAVTSATPTTPQLAVSISGPTSVMVGDVVNFTAIGYDQATYSWTFQNGTPATATGQSASTTWNAGGTYLVTVTATLGTQTVSASMTVNVTDCPVNQLPFSFGAEASDPLECMFVYDADGDGNGWNLLSDIMGQENITSYVHSGSDVLASASYINNVGALTPDNWLVLPKVHIPAGGATITWWDKGLDANYASEYYSVMLSSATGATTDFTTVLWNGTSTGSWRQCTASIENFDNQDVYIAFRHHNITDMYWLLIDDILVSSSGSATDTSATALGDTISYCANNQYASNVGTGSTTSTMSWGVRFPASMLTGKNYLDEVLIYIPEGYGGNYTMSVYQGGTTAPQTLLFNNTYYFNSNLDNYKSCAISGGVAINNNQDLWVVFSNTDIGYPASACSYTGDPNSDFLSLDGQTWSHCYTDYSLDYSWLIKAIASATAPDPTLDVVISGPSSVLTGTTASFSAYSSTGATYTWSLQGATPATATGQTVSATWNNTGIYTVSVTASLNGITATDAITVNVADCSVNQLPYTMGFEADEDIQCLSFVDADTDGYGWLFSSAVTSSAVAYNGSECIMSASYINNVGAINPDNWMILPAVAIPSGGATMTWYDKAFDADYYEDYYEVLLSINGTSTSDFTTLLWYGTPSSDGDWTQRTVTIPAAYAHQNINIAFRHYNCSDYYWVLIDDISITAGGATPGDTTVTWNWGDTISYCGDDAYESGIGIGANGEITWGIKIPSQYMTGRNYLSSAMAYISNPGSYELLIYNPQSGAYPSTPIYQQTYNVTASSDWYTFPLSSTVALNTSNDLWVVLHCTGINYPASYSSYSGDTNSSMVFMDNTWYTIQSLASDLNPTWMIKAVTSATPTTPQLTVSISGPTSVIVGDVVTFTAIGYDQATYGWTFQNGTPATATGQSASTTWSAGGTYLVTVTATLGTQTVSASMTVNVTDCPVNQLPFSFGAEASDPLECMSTHDADADGYGWILLSNMISGDAISSYVHSGSDALASASYINNVGALTPDNWVVLPKVHIPTGGATITWWDKGLDASFANEYYSVMISSATGATTDFTTELWSGITTDSWRQCTASIENFDNQDVYIAFRHHNVSDMYWLLIDDISITSGFDLQVSINGPSVVAPYEPATFTAIGAAGATYTWTFEGAAPSTATGQTVTTSWNSEGSYMVTVTAMLNGDVVSDTITVTVAESQGDELSYGIEDDPLGNVGIDDEVTWGIRFEPAMLVGRDRLAYVSAYIAVAGSYELMVYQGGVDTPDSMLFQQSYTITDTNVWYDFDPGMDLDIDQSQSLWILLHTTDIAYPISVTQFTGDTNSCLIDLDGNGVFVAPVLSSGDDDYFYVSWMIKAFTVTDLQEPVIVDIQCLGDGEGIVLTPNSIENVCGQALFYTQGQEVMLGFMPNMGSVLSHVYVGQVDMVDMLDTVDFEEAGEVMTAYILSFVADSTTLVEVFFNNPEANYMVTVNVNDPAMGYVEGSGSYSYGDVAELTAISYSGYNFEGWDDGDQSNPRLVTVTSDTTFTAIFADGQEGIDQAGGSSIIVTTQHSDIVVVGADAQSLFIFDAIGRRLFATDQARHEERYTVPAAGIYIVKASDGTVQRVVVL